METGQQVAIKILKPNLCDSALKTILTEINALKALKQHPNIVKLFGYNQSEYIKRDSSMMMTYIVIELAAGGELFNLL